MIMTSLQTSGFHHVTMVSSDVRRTLTFFRDLLGVGLVKRTVDFDDPSSYHLYFGDAAGSPGTILTFFERERGTRGHWGVGGVHHLALGVESPEAQLKWKRRLTDAGVSVSGPFNRGYFRSIYFKDPDGQILEIATRGPGYTIDEPVESLGMRDLIPPGAELRGERDERAIDARTHPEPVPVITPDMALEGIHHVSAITSDLDRLNDFYVGALGLSLIKRSFNQDDSRTRHWFWASYDGATVAPHSAITFFGWPKGGKPAAGGVGQMHQVAFRASSDDELLAWRDHLLSLGVDVSPVMDRTYFKSIHFRDPDGLLLEIATDGPGFTIDEEREALGSVLRLPAWLESERSRIEDELIPLEGAVR
jgi:glyoxalase family protein